MRSIIATFAIVLLLAGIARSASAQSHPLEIQLLLLTDKPAEAQAKSSSENAEKIRDIVAADKDMCACTEKLQNKFYEQFRLLDLDRDGDLDLLFDGECKSSSKVRVWMKTKDGYKRAFEAEGKLIWLDDAQSGMSIGMRKDDLECDHLKRASVLQFSKTKPDQVESASLEWHKDLKWTRYDLRSAERITSKDDELRLSPEIDDEKRKSKCSSDPIPGNLYTRLEGETSGARLDFNDEGWAVYMVQKSGQKYMLGWVKER